MNEIQDNKSYMAKMKQDLTPYYLIGIKYNDSFQGIVFDIDNGIVSGGDHMTIPLKEFFVYLVELKEIQLF